MGILANPSHSVNSETNVVSLTAVQRALWQLGLPILAAEAVAEYKKRAKLGMLWGAVRWHLAGMAALVGLVGLGRQWERVALVAACAVVLATLFSWLVWAAELRWLTMTYRAYRDLHEVPAQVSAAANALTSSGVSESQIGVEYLKNDPILFVEDSEESSGGKRYDLIIW